MIPNVGIRAVRARATVALALVLVAALAFALYGNARAGDQLAVFPDDQVVRVQGFKVELSETGIEPDATWDSVSGGSLNVEFTESMAGTDQFDHVTVGRSFVEEVELAGRMTHATGTNAQFLENGAGRFLLEIDGLGVANDNVQRITADPLTISFVESSTSQSQQYRVYQASESSVGDVTIEVRRGNQPSGLFQWWEDVSQGQIVRKNVAVSLRDRQGNIARTWTYLDCTPRRWSPLGGGFSATSTIATESITLRCERVEFTQTGGSDAPRTPMFQWLTDTMEGQDEIYQRNVTITEFDRDGADGAAYTYIDAFPTSYEFPELDVSAEGTLEERITFKPIRLELQ